MKLSKIGFTDFSGGNANFVLRGKHDCECSPGCQNCFMAALDKRFNILPETTTVYPEKLARLAKAKFPDFSRKRGAPHKPMVFVCDGGDLLHPAVPDEFIGEAFAVMLRRPDVVWQVLTKRAARMRALVNRWFGPVPIVPYIWLGVSVEDQKRADERIPQLLNTPALVRFVSLEPLLEPVTIESWLTAYGEPVPARDDPAYVKLIDWAVVGAESGANRRYFDENWARTIRDQCQRADVAFFGKQDSAIRPGKPLLFDGQEIKEWPC